MEHGRIEQPAKPVIRLSTPVFNRQGELQGVMILNYLGQLILNEVIISDSANRGELMMINQQGYWLYSADQHKNWSFMYGKKDSFASSYPTAWTRLRDNRAGQFHTDEGMFTYLTISPTEMLGPSNTSFVSEEWWKLVSMIPQSSVSINSENRLHILYKLSPVIILLLGLVAWFWTRVSLEAERGRLKIKHLSRVVEQTEELVFITDPQARIQYVNPAFERVTGYQQAEVIGKTPNLLKSEAHGDTYYKRLWKTIRSGKPFKGVFVNRRKDGTLYHEEKIISPIYNEMGRLIQFVSTGREIRDQNANAKDNLEMDRLTVLDRLTKLPNRLSIIEELKQAMQRAEDSGKFMAVAMIDLDAFDWVNETYGHYKGDQVLISFAQRLQRSLSKNDGLSRFGGDEFLIIMEGANDPEELEHKLEIVLVTVTSPFVVDNINIHINANMGVVFHPLEEIDHKTLLTQVENAIHRSKTAGKNKICFYSQDQTSQEETED